MIKRLKRVDDYDRKYIYDLLEESREYKEKYPDGIFYIVPYRGKWYLTVKVEDKEGER